MSSTRDTIDRLTTQMGRSSVKIQGQALNDLIGVIQNFLSEKEAAKELASKIPEYENEISGLKRKLNARETETEEKREIKEEIRKGEDSLRRARDAARMHKQMSDEIRRMQGTVANLNRSIQDAA